MIRSFRQSLIRYCWTVLAVCLVAMPAGAQMIGPGLAPEEAPPRIDSSPPGGVYAGDAPDTDFPYVASTHEVHTWMGDGNVRIIDVRQSYDYYLDGHIDGSVRMRWTDFAGWGEDAEPFLDPDGRVAHDHKRKELAVSRARLTVPSVRVIVVGSPERDWGEAAYVVYALRQWGYPNVALMDGGVPAWKFDGRPFTRSWRTPPPADVLEYPPDFYTRQTLTAPDVDRLIATGTVRLVLDSRTLGEFEGRQTSSPLPVRGRIGGAKHLEWTLVYPRMRWPSGQWLSREKIQSLAVERGIFPDTPVVVYDSWGLRSAAVWLALRSAGYRNVQHFPGGFAEWTAYPGYRIETGPASPR